MSEDPNDYRYNFGLGPNQGSQENFSDSPFADELAEIGGRAYDTLLGIDVDDTTGLEQSTYDFKYRVFPEDLTMQDNAHYMVLNINVPVYRGKEGQNRSQYNPGRILPNEYSKVDNLRFGNIVSVTGDPLPPGNQAEYLSIPRNTRRIAESIALHMPNGGLVYTEDNQYEPISMTAMAGGIVSAAGKFGEIAGKAANIFNAATQVVKNGGKLAGYPINPRIEVLFGNRPQRQWMFEVFLAPRSPKESYTAKKIIDTLRYHAAPELGGGGFYFIPPAEFDITFFRQGVENLNLPRINTCVLERIDIDYAPQGGVYSTFRDGTPVAIRLSLGFREIEIVHKRRVLQGF